MPSFLSRLVPIYLRVTGAQRIFASTDAAQSRVEERRRTPPVARVPRRLTVTTDTSHGWPIHTVIPRTPNGSAVIYLHGGAWVNDIAAQHWQLISQLVDAGTTVVVPLYPLVPVGTAGPVLDAVVAQVMATRTQHGRVSIAGDSAGGQIALSAALVLRDEFDAILNATVLIAPALDLAMRNPEMDLVQSSDPWLAKPGTRVFIDLWRGDLPLLDPRVSPIEGDLAGLGPMVIFSGTRDILNPDARLLAERAREAGVDVEYHEGEGLVHVYPLTPTPEGREARRLIVERLS